jgi:Ca2+/Na+ antiporter
MILISNNIILVAISGLIAIIYSIVHFYDESIDKKKRILLLVCVLIIVIIQIAKLVIEKL